MLRTNRRCKRNPHSNPRVEKALQKHRQAVFARLKQPSFPRDPETGKIIWDGRPLLPIDPDILPGLDGFRDTAPL